MHGAPVSNMICGESDARGLIAGMFFNARAEVER